MCKKWRDGHGHTRQQKYGRLRKAPSAKGAFAKDVATAKSMHSKRDKRRKKIETENSFRRITVCAHGLHHWEFVFRGLSIPPRKFHVVFILCPCMHKWEREVLQFLLCIVGETREKGIALWWAVIPACGFWAGLESWGGVLTAGSSVLAWRVAGLFVGEGSCLLGYYMKQTAPFFNMFFYLFMHDSQITHISQHGIERRVYS